MDSLEYNFRQAVEQLAIVVHEPGFLNESRKRQMYQQLLDEYESVLAGENYINAVQDTQPHLKLCRIACDPIR